MASKVCAPLLDPETQIFIEDYFAELLRVERKRSERSKDPFLLILFDISAFEEGEYKRDIINRIVSALFSSIRDIDVIGWYKYDTVIGIMFREMKEDYAHSISVRDLILQRIYQNLQSRLDPGQLRNILVSSHAFPESDLILLTNAPLELATPLDLNLYPDMSLTSKSPGTVFSFFIKTLMDVFGSLFAIIIFLVPLIVIAILVKYSSKGPILFRQERIGLFGKPFTFLKFRSMYVHESADIHKKFMKTYIKGDTDTLPPEKGRKDKVFKIKDDPRVTPIGKFLRKTSLDELPQLFNVLKGDMALVGPRPPIPYEYEQYDIWHKGRILEFKPGITGLWQVEGRSSTSFNEMVRLDLKYIRDWSLWLDIKILFRTPVVVIKGKGAY